MDWIILLGIAILIWLCLRIIDRLGDIDKKMESLWERINRLADEVHAQPEYESEMDKIIRRRRRDNAKLGIYPDHR